MADLIIAPFNSYVHADAAAWSAEKKEVLPQSKSVIFVHNIEKEDHADAMQYLRDHADGYRVMKSRVWPSKAIRKLYKDAQVPSDKLLWTYGKAAGEIAAFAKEVRKWAN